MNSFDLLRLLAAVAVIFHHCFPAAGLPPVRWLDINPGELGVGVFFVISGYLVTGSLERSASIRDYLAKRLLRIEPALIVSTVITALVLGAAVTSLPLGDYFRSSQVYLYILRNSLMYPVTYDLPGVFEHNPLPHVVNASLWTLRLEFSCYLGLAALGWAGLLRKWTVAALATAAAAVFVFLHIVRPDLVDAGVLHQVYFAALNGLLFLASAFLRLLGRAPPYWAVLGGAALLLTPLWPIGLAPVVIAIGERRSIRLPADVSYGLYIYAFPMQQILAAHGRLSFWTALAATLPFAIASWFLVERPALRLKPKSGLTPTEVDRPSHIPIDASAEAARVG